MPNFVFRLKQLLILAYFFLFISQLFGQGQSKIIHVDVISETDKIEISFIFDNIIDRDDVSGWIDRTNYFTLSLFNISLNAEDVFDKKYKYPLISVEAADTDGSVQIIFNTAKIIESLKLLSDALIGFNANCVKGLIANKKKINQHLNNSLMLVTALNDKIGYYKAAEIANNSYKNGTTLKEEALKLKYLSEEEFDKWVDPNKMTGR